MIDLTKIAETTKTITLGWTPVVGCVGYAFYADGVRKANTWDPTTSQVKFAKGAAKYEVVAIGVVDSGVYPSVAPPPPPPPETLLPSLFALNGWVPASVQRVAAGTYSSLTVTGTDKRVVLDQGVTLTGQLFVGSCSRVEIVWDGAVSRGSHDGIKFTGSNKDVWVHGFDISGVRNQGILGVGVNENVWITDGVIADNNPDPANPDWRTQCHGIYLGSQGSWVGGVLGNVRVLRQTTGYGFQGYESCQGLIVTSCEFNTPGTTGFRSDVGIATLWSGSSSGNIVANTIARDCRGPLAAGGAGAQVPAVTVKSSAEVNCGTYPDGQPGAVSGIVGNDPTISGDPGYRLPWDARFSGIGPF